jgi:hypothetical protein
MKSAKRRRGALLSAALTYAKRGWRILPVHSVRNERCSCGRFPCGEDNKNAGKHPRIVGWVKRATTSRKEIKRWWGRWPSANIGVATGRASGLLVVDVDPRNGGDKSLASLVEAHGDLPPTITVRTGGGGTHLYFRHPRRKKASWKLAKGVDLRSNGGFVVAPPASHLTGKAYSWILGPRGELAEAPKWLADLAFSRRSAPDSVPADAGKPLQAGERNTGLTSLGGALRARGLSEAAICAALLVHNDERCAPPLEDAEVRGIAKSVGKYSPEETKERGGKGAAADVLVGIGRQCTLFRDERGTAYAVVRIDSGPKTLRVRSSEFKNWLARTYYQRIGKAASAEAKNSALSVLEGDALHAGPGIELDNRFALRGSHLWLDLNDGTGRALRFGRNKWRVVKDPPILFRRYSHQQSLPIPQRGGDLRELLQFLNVADRETEMLLLAWLVVALRPDIPRPILWLHGTQGSAKTTAAQMLRALIDPSAVDVMPLGIRDQEILQILDHHAVPIFDNVGNLQAWQSDLLCRAVTGGGNSKRRLFSDDDDVIIHFQRPIIVTGINITAIAPDLLERCLLVGLSRIDPADRRERAAVWREFEEARPRILGGLAGAYVHAAATHRTIRIQKLERMADFARWGAAAATALGYGADDFVDALARNAKRQQEEALDADPVGGAILKLVRRKDPWRGTATKLMAELERYVSDSARRGPSWPKTATILSRRLKTISATLEDFGVRITFASAHRTAKVITIETVRLGKPASSPSSASHTKLAATGLNGRSEDGGDGEDGVLHHFSPNVCDS